VYRVSPSVVTSGIVFHVGVCLVYVGGRSYIESRNLVQKQSK
jgi:hypothetical protein